MLGRGKRCSPAKMDRNIAGAGSWQAARVGRAAPAPRCPQKWPGPGQRQGWGSPTTRAAGLTRNHRPQARWVRRCSPGRAPQGRARPWPARSDAAAGSERDAGERAGGRPGRDARRRGRRVRGIGRSPRHGADPAAPRWTRGRHWGRSGSGEASGEARGKAELRYLAVPATPVGARGLRDAGAGGGGAAASSRRGAHAPWHGPAQPCRGVPGHRGAGGVKWGAAPGQQVPNPSNAPTPGPAPLAHGAARRGSGLSRRGAALTCTPLRPQRGPRPGAGLRAPSSFPRGAGAEPSRA